MNDPTGERAWAYCWADVCHPTILTITVRCSARVPSAISDPDHIGLCDRHLEELRAASR